MELKNTTKITRTLRVVFAITDKKSVTYSIENPSAGLGYQDVKDWADDAVDKEAFVIDGLAVTAFKEAYIETVTKEYLENE